MNKKQFLEEMVEYYRTHPRGLSPSGKRCVYLSAKGNMCAVGRCFNEEGLKFYGGYDGGVKDLLGEMDAFKGKEHFFKPQYHDILDGKFLSAVQDLHDLDFNWHKIDGGQVLSAKGERIFNALLNDYA